jgi:hypothetical protein
LSARARERSGAPIQGVEGHCVVEGILEGPMPPIPGFAEFLDEWKRGLAQAGIALVVTVDGGRFDVHAPELEIEVPDVGRDPVDTLAEALGVLIARVPDGDRARLHSTLRATVFGRGTQRRTLFALRSPGVLEVVEDRTVAVTAPAPRPDLSRAARHWAFWVTLVLASALFLTFGPTLSPLGWGELRTLDPAAIELTSAPGGVAIVRLDREVGAHGTWYAVLERRTAAPRVAPPLDDAGAWLEWLGTARGRAHLEWRDDTGNVLRVDPIDVSGLGVGQELMLHVPTPPKDAARLRFGW